MSKIISNLPNKRSCGYDGISNMLIKKIAPSLITPLCIAINKSIESGEVPDNLKIAQIVPVYKSKDSQVFTNYRPISLLLNISKILENVIHKRIYKFSHDRERSFSSQYGFRNHRSTNHAISEFLSNVLTDFDEKKYTLAIFLDLSKAFDTIDHQILLNKLEHYGIRGFALIWIKSYLSGRKQFVEFKGVKSTFQQVTCGVPQGSVLGPLLFIIYMNDLACTLQSCSGILFADDTTIHKSDKSLPILFHHMNADLERVTQWFRANKLSLNTSKTHYVLFHNSIMDVPEFDYKIKMAGVEIERVNQAVFLGLTLDSNLHWGPYIKTIESKLSSALYDLRRVSNMLPKDSLKTLYYSLVYSKLQYSIMHWGNKSTYAYKIDRLIKQQNKAICIINKNKSTSLVDPLYAASKVLKFHDVVKLEMLKLMYDYNNSSLPEPLMNIFKDNKTIHNYNTRHANDPHLKTYHYKIASESFLHRAPYLWSKLGHDIVTSKSKSSFVKKIKKSILAGY